jgi:pyruvate kinase
MIPSKTYARTKIVATLGPASQDVDILVKLFQSGMDVARLNFSHGTHAMHEGVLKNVREACKRSGENITILQDLSGPKIRTGLLEESTVVLKNGEKFTFTIDDIRGTAQRVSTTYKRLPQDVRIGDEILMDDGKLKVRVTSKTEKEVICEVVTGGILAEKKGMNLPGVKVSVSSFTDKDVEDLKFGLANDIDYVALSFVRSADDIRQLREVIIREVQKGKRVPIVAKIEKPEAVENIDEIIKETDAIMVARGDLGVELPTEDVPLVQKMIVRKCNEAGVPVIVATQMLESMIGNPRPTRAEANDVANAVLDGADAVMLSGETSVGGFPVEAVQVMDRIIRKAEEQHRDHLDIAKKPTNREYISFDAIGRASCVIADQVGAKAIVTITHSGFSAMNTAKYRPKAQIIAVTAREKILRRLNLVWGIHGITVPDMEGDTDKALKHINEELIKQGIVQKGDYVVTTVGIPLFAQGSTNTIKVEKIE